MQSVVLRACACVVSICLAFTGYGFSAAADDSLAAAGFRLLSLNNKSTKWGDPAPGRGAVIRYAFAASSLDRPGSRNCRTMEPLRASSLPNGPAAEDFRREFRRAMDSWERVADIRFVPASDGQPADLIIGFQRKPRGIAYADVQPVPLSPGAIARTSHAAVCLNPNLPWETNFDGNPATPDVRYVAAHELGHVLGLDHSRRRGEATLMDFRNSETIRVPQPGDVAGAVLLYGEPLLRNTRASVAHISE